MDERRWFFCPSASACISKIFTLTWHNVDFVNPIATVTNENAKSGKARALLLNNDAIKLLRKLRFKNNCEYFFFQQINDFTISIEEILNGFVRYQK